MFFCFSIMMNIFFSWQFFYVIMIFSFIFFWICLFLYGLFDKNYSSYQFMYMKHCVLSMNMEYCIGFGLDGISFVFIVRYFYYFIWCESMFIYM